MPGPSGHSLLSEVSRTWSKANKMGISPPTPPLRNCSKRVSNVSVCHTTQEHISEDAPFPYIQLSWANLSGTSQALEPSLILNHNYGAAPVNLIWKEGEIYSPRYFPSFPNLNLILYLFIQFNSVISQVCI